MNFDKQDLALFGLVIQQYHYDDPTLKFHKEQNDLKYIAIVQKIKISIVATCEWNLIFDISANTFCI